MTTPNDGPRDPWASFGQLQAPVPQSGTDGFSIAAIVLGILPLFAGVLGIVFGFLGLRRIKTSGQGGRKLAITGIVAGFLWIAVLIAAVALGAFDTAHRDSSGAVVAGGSSTLSDIQVGDCVATLPTGEVHSVHVTPCAHEHVAEVFALFDLTGVGYPGDAQVRTDARVHCTSLLDAYVGVLPGRPSGYALNFLRPQESTWSRSHTVRCLLVAPGSMTMTESARGQGHRGALPTAADLNVRPGLVKDTVAIDDLEVGSCTASDLSSGSHETADVLPCDGPHGGEVFAVFSLTGTAYPGLQAVDARVITTCRQSLAPFVGVRPGTSGYGILYFSPSPEGWAGGDHVATCILSPPPGGSLTAEAKGAGAFKS